ncbi:MAG: CDP-alcohol phosphatidyltransferase family protein [Rhodospirillaceae bacterium]|nr:CDP-alcohol phosphatidyltransferase family protein [Rhodospirillales bacterium]
MSTSQPNPLAARWIGSSPIRIWGLPPAERLRRTLTRVGLGDAGPWTGSPSPPALLLLLGDHVYDDALVAALTKAPGTVVVVHGCPVAAHVPRELAEHMALALTGDAAIPEGLAQAKPDDLVATHRTKLRKRQPSFVLPVTAETARQVEDHLFAASYKGVTDAVTKYAWPRPAKSVTRWCVALGVSPNAVTLVSLVLAVLAIVLFYDAKLWAGLACAWGMTFLDTVDGKLARVTLTSSKLGDALDHGLDLIHPPIWWWAWWAGTGSQDTIALAVVLAGYVFLRLQEGFFLWRFGIEMHVWQRFDSRFRLVTARRNPILVILTVALALGEPALGFHISAAWTLLSLAVHTARILKAARTAAGQHLSSWLAA